jgi:hypothetical protein
MDLMGPTRTASLGGKKYILVVVDDYLWYTWIRLLKEKSEAFDQATILFKQMQVEQDCLIQRIRSDHGREFENSNFEDFCNKFGIKHEFSSPITPQQNGVVEWKNRVIQEMARVMLHAKQLAQHFWGEAVHTACHIINRVFLWPTTNKTPYEIWRGKKPTVRYFKVFGSKCYILRDRESLGKFDAKSDVGIFLGYSTSSQASRVYNIRTQVVMESVNVVIDDEYITDQIEEEQAEVQQTTDQNEGERAEFFKKNTTCSKVVPADTHQNEEGIDEKSATPQSPNSNLVVKEPLSRVKLNHPQDNLLGTINEG